MPISVTVKPITNKRTRALAARVLSGDVLSKTQLTRVAQIVRDTKEKESQEFLRLMREKSGKTDEELLEELKPILGKQVKNPKGGRPAGAIEQRMNDKILMAWRLSNRGQTWDQITKLMDVNISQVAVYMKRARELMRVDPTQINLPQQIGETLGFYDDVRQMALMHASTGANTNTKLSAINIALSVQRDKNEFLTKVGVYSPSVVESFKQLVLAQVTVLMGDKEKDKVPDNHIDIFYSTLATQLLECASVTNPSVQLIADAEVLEGDRASS